MARLLEGREVTRVEFTELTWPTERVTGFIDLAYRVAAKNRNKRGVADEITCVTDDLDVVYGYPVKHGKTDSTNLGTTFYFTYWHPETRTHRKAAVIHLDPKRTWVVTTFAHEVAHALTAGTHGYTWRRMNALLLPLAWKTFRPELVVSGHLWVDVHCQVTTDVQRYGRRYESGWVAAGNVDASEEYLHRVEKIEREVAAHVAAAKRYFKMFGG